ncbi:MAG: prolyl-tRNA editing protein [Clostridiales bacterium 43-6]|nr:MAG: prolyl-tRNA editing protein [Clostridiales bacterium 43-6]
MNQVVIDKTIYSTAPTDGNRLSKEARSYALLEQLNIPFLRLDHRETATIDACLEVEEILGIEICKNLFLSNTARTDFYLLMMPGSKRFQTKLLSRQIGTSRLSFGEAMYMERFLDITPGSVSVLGLMNDKGKNVRLLVDRDLLKEEFFGCHPCINTSSLKIKTMDLFDKFLPHTGHTPTFVDL